MTARVVAGMVMSLDGFVAGNGVRAEDSADSAMADSDVVKSAIAETGAVVMGRRTFEMAEDPDSYVGNYEFQVPIFVVTHTPPRVPPKQDERLTFTFVTDGVESAVKQAKAAAGDGAVQVVGGADLIQQLLLAGLVDELVVGVEPLFHGTGLRFFDSAELARVGVQLTDVQEMGTTRWLRYRSPDAGRGAYD